MIEDEGGPRPIPEDRETDPAGASGKSANQGDDASSNGGAGKSDDDDRAIDVDLAHDRAS